MGGLCFTTTGVQGVLGWEACVFAHQAQEKIFEDWFMCQVGTTVLWAF